jgi:hypothetical protein
MPDEFFNQQSKKGTTEEDSLVPREQDPPANERRSDPDVKEPGDWREWPEAPKSSKTSPQ